MNSPELYILKYILNKALYIKYKSYINISKDLKEIYILYQSLDILHSKIDSPVKSVDELESMVYISYPRMSPSEREAIHGLCEQIRSVEISDQVFEEMLRLTVQRAETRNLALAALEASEGKRSIEELSDIFTRVVNPKEITKKEYRFVSHNLRELRSVVIDEPGLNWRLKSLRSSLGPLRKGNFGFAFARPETGKTTFLASEISYMAQQIQPDERIVWFNNEEVGENVQTRISQAALNLTSDQLFAEGDLDKWNTEYDTIIGDRILVERDCIFRRDIENLVEDFKPKLILFDQIDKIKGFDADRPDIVFGHIYQWARELAKAYCPIIGICQADGTGEGVKWLHMGHVAEAKTSKQAEADWILGIGRSNESGTEDVRFLNISKNKLMGSRETDPELRHGRFEVFIRPQYARYEDILN